MLIMSYGITIRSHDRVLLVINFNYLLHILCMLGVVFALLIPKHAITPQRRYFVFLLGCISLYYNRGMYSSMFGHTPPVSTPTPSVDFTSPTTSTVYELYGLDKYSDSAESQEGVTDHSESNKEGRIKYIENTDEEVWEANSISSKSRGDIGDIGANEVGEL